MAVLLAGLGLGAAKVAQAKPFLDYIKPAPIVCSPLSSATWGVAGVLPRDLCNGIESAKGAAVPPEFYYWDGQILKAKDGKYHMFMSTWSGTAGFNPGWQSSDAYHAISSQGVLGPYMRQGFVYTNNNSHKGHNVSALELPDGSYAVVVSEIVPFTIYRSTSLDGPWTGCVAQIQTNGIKTVSTVACPPGGACGDAHHEANVSLVARHDGKYEIVQRHGFIALADTLCGPYKMQKPTWAYPQANLPNVDSIYPKRTSIPGVSNPTYGWEEDPHIWYSAGIYHVIYSGSQDRVGYHLYSSDGLTNWKDNGYGWSPRDYQKIFGYEGSTTYTQWYKMERPGVVLENGHPTHITWAVADVDKDNQIPAGSNHGSKVIVVPFDGVAFDADFGTSGPAEPAVPRGRAAPAARAASRGRAEARAPAVRGVAARGEARAAADVAARRAAGRQRGRRRTWRHDGRHGGQRRRRRCRDRRCLWRRRDRRRDGDRRCGRHVTDGWWQRQLGFRRSWWRRQLGLWRGDERGRRRRQYWWLLVQRSWRHHRQWRLHVHPGRRRRFRLRLRLGLGLARRRAPARSAAGRVGHADSQATEPPKP